MEQKALKLIMAGLLILSMALTGREAAEYVGAMHAVNALRETGMGADDSGRLCVVVDAGHGGDDPGKIGINGAPEKDINLQIAQKLKKYLEAEDVEVVLTRETEDGLYDAHASNKKVQDMKRRIEIIEKTDPVLTVSIHAVFDGLRVVFAVFCQTAAVAFRRHFPMSVAYHCEKIFKSYSRGSFTPSVDK